MTSECTHQFAIHRCSACLFDSLTAKIREAYQVWFEKQNILA